MWKNDFVRGEREHIKYRRRLGDEGTPTYEAKAINPTYSGVGVRWKCNVLGFTVVHPNLRMMNWNNWEEDVRYRRADVAGGTYFFTVNLAERKGCDSN